MPKERGKPITLKDLARECQLSTAAVSSCLDSNPRSTSRVSRETIERVRNMADKLGYRHNRAARSLRKGSSETIGMICFPAFLRFSPMRLTDVTQTVKERDFFPYVHHVPDMSAKSCRSACDAMLDQRVDGVLLLKPNLFPEKEVKRLLKAGIPVIAINAFDAMDNPGIPVYVPDKEMGYSLLTQHLIEQGYRSIYLVATYFGKDSARTSQLSSALKGFHQVIRQQKERDPASFGVFRLNDPASLPNVDHLEHIEPLSLAGYAFAKRLVATSTQLPDALLCQTTTIASGMMRAFAEDNVRVPWDVALAGFSEESFTSTGQIPLTTVDHSFDQQCHSAVNHLIRLIHQKEMPRKEMIRNPFHLLARQSSLREKQAPLMDQRSLERWMPTGDLRPLPLEGIVSIDV